MEIVKKDNTPRVPGSEPRKSSRWQLETVDGMVDLKGNKLPMVVAMINKCVAHYRKWMRPLKTIYLCPAYYVQFTDWVRYHATEREADLKCNLYTWFGVNIDQMDDKHILRSSKDDRFDWDFYSNDHNKES